MNLLGSDHWRATAFALVVLIGVVAMVDPPTLAGDWHGSSGHSGHGHSFGHGSFGHGSFGHSHSFGHSGYGHSGFGFSLGHSGYGHHSYYSPHYSGYGSHYYGYSSPYAYSSSPYRSGRTYSYRPSYGGLGYGGSVAGSTGDGWSLLGQGHAAEALQSFAIQAENHPTAGMPKVGYALSAAAGGDLSTGVWAMRRACRIDPQSMHTVTLSKELRPTVQRLIDRYGPQPSGSGGSADSSFMLAALYYLMQDPQPANAAIQAALQQGDRSSSAANLASVIQQAVASS